MSSWDDEQEAYREGKLSDGAQIAWFFGILSAGSVLVALVRWLAQVVFA